MVYAFDPARHIDKTFYPHTRYNRIVAGVDWGFANPAAIILGGVLNESPLRIHVFEEWVHPRVTTPKMVEKLKELQDKYGVVQFFIDESAPDLIAQAYDAGVRVDPEDPCNRDVPGGIAAVAAMMESDPPRLTFAPGLATLFFEIGHYKYEDTMDANLNEKPKKKNDHGMDGLRYMVVGARDSYQPFEPEVAGKRMDWDTLL